jgi:hypothetical protein
MTASKKIGEIAAWITAWADGREEVTAIFNPERQTWLPLVGADVERITRWAPVARAAAADLGGSADMVRFRRVAAEERAGESGCVPSIDFNRALATARHLAGDRRLAARLGGDGRNLGLAHLALDARVVRLARLVRAVDAASAEIRRVAVDSSEAALAACREAHFEAEAARIALELGDLAAGSARAG